MQKSFMVLFILIMFFGIAGCPSDGDLTNALGKPDTISKPATDQPYIVGSVGDEGNNAVVPEPVTLVLFGSGLVGLGVVGRKWFKK